ncbi:hypothetical protein D3C81_860920 [compost metagenome]
MGAGKTEGRAVRHDATGGVKRNFALTQQGLIQIQLEEAPKITLVGLAPITHVVFEIVFRLLEMMRAQKHPFSPDDLMSIFHRHTYSYFAWPWLQVSRDLSRSAGH